ncbi:MAG: hypothetical protein C0518_12055 [Opitutus sp.]|nr:hypothetical protein [Opitutus sp.]
MKRPARRAFTLLEVMVASVVLLFGIVSAIGAMQAGLQAMDRARHVALATQLLQSELEQLRLKNWTQLESLQAAGATATFTPDRNAGAAAGRFTCSRQIATLRADMKEITLTAEWRGYDGRPHTTRLITRYAKNGLNDYISTAH